MSENEQTASNGEAAAVWVRVADLSPWADNPRRNEAAVPEVMASIRRFGFAAPIVARRADGEIIAGHTRLEAARRLGLDRVPVRYMDLDPADAHLLALADNKVGEIAEWDDEKLAAVLRDLDVGEATEGLGFSEDELRDLLGTLGEDVPVPESDEPPEVDEQGEPDSQPGVVYELGPHRLLCGDATGPESWDRVCGDDTGAVVITSPPYGVGKSHHLRNHLAAGVPTPKTRFYGQHDDRATEWRGMMDAFTSCAINHARCVVVNVQMLAENKRDLLGWMADNRRRLIDVVVWDKGTGPPQASPSTLTTVWEFVIGLGDESASRRWPMASFQGDRANMIRVSPRESGAVSAEVHGARYPVAFARSMIETLADDAIVVVDPFGGTGTTLIACAETGRVARLIEIDPRYCDLIRRRWTRWAIANGRDPGPGALRDEPTS